MNRLARIFGGKKTITPNAPEKTSATVAERISVGDLGWETTCEAEEESRETTTDLPRVFEVEHGQKPHRDSGPAAARLPLSSELCDSVPPQQPGPDSSYDDSRAGTLPDGRMPVLRRSTDETEEGEALFESWGEEIKGDTEANATLTEAALQQIESATTDQPADHLGRVGSGRTDWSEVSASTVKSLSDVPQPQPQPKCDSAQEFEPQRVPEPSAAPFQGSSALAKPNQTAAVAEAEAEAEADDLFSSVRVEPTPDLTSSVQIETTSDLTSSVRIESTSDLMSSVRIDSTREPNASQVGLFQPTAGGPHHDDTGDEVQAVVAPSTMPQCSVEDLKWECAICCYLNEEEVKVCEYCHASAPPGLQAEKLSDRHETHSPSCVAADQEQKQQEKGCHVTSVQPPVEEDLSVAINPAAQGDPPPPELPPADILLRRKAVAEGLTESLREMPPAETRLQYLEKARGISAEDERTKQRVNEAKFESSMKEVQELMEKTRAEAEKEANRIREQARREAFLKEQEARRQKLLLEAKKNLIAAQAEAAAIKENANDEAQRLLKKAEDQAAQILHEENMLRRPEWRNEQECSQCGSSFGRVIYPWRHHCRSCGKSFCNACSSVYLPLKELGYDDDQRHCLTCARIEPTESRSEWLLDALSTAFGWLKDGNSESTTTSEVQAPEFVPGTSPTEDLDGSTIVVRMPSGPAVNGQSAAAASAVGPAPGDVVASGSPAPAPAPAPAAAVVETAVVATLVPEPTPATPVVTATALETHDVEPNATPPQPEIRTLQPSEAAADCTAVHVAPAPAPTQPITAKGGKGKGKGAGPPQRGSVQAGGRGKGKGAAPAPAAPYKVAAPSKPREGPSKRDLLKKKPMSLMDELSAKLKKRSKEPKEKEPPKPRTDPEPKSDEEKKDLKGFLGFQLNSRRKKMDEADDDDDWD